MKYIQILSREKGEYDDHEYNFNLPHCNEIFYSTKEKIEDQIFINLASSSTLTAEEMLTLSLLVFLVLTYNLSDDRNQRSLDMMEVFGHDFIFKRFIKFFVMILYQQQNKMQKCDLADNLFILLNSNCYIENKQLLNKISNYTRFT